MICAYTERRWPALCEAIDSVLAQSLLPEDIVVVIDHDDALLARARETFASDEEPSVRVLGNAEARGLSGARNTGVRAATGDVVAFLDDDASADGDWLATTLAAYDDDTTVFATGGLVVPRWTADAPRWLPEQFYWTVGCSYRGLPSGRVPIRNPIGANMSFRKAVLDEIGGFREGLGRIGRTPLGCEETELAIRARQRDSGRIVLFVPEARVEHAVTPDRASARYFRSRCWAEGISKAAVSATTGAEDGLASERSYVRRTLPAGVAHGIADAARGDPHGLLRAVNIVLGLAITAAGYVRGRVGAAGSRARRSGSDPLFRSAYSLMANTVLTSTLGVGFWIVAARLYPADLVGRDSALIASMVTLSVICQLNMGNAMLRFVPALAGGTSRAVLWAYAVASGTSLAVASAFVLVAPAVSSSFQVLQTEPGFAIAYVLGTTLWSVFTLQDNALTALRQTHWVPVENTVYGLLKLAALPVFATVALSAGVFLSWVIPMMLLLIPVNAFVFGRAVPRHMQAQRERGTSGGGLERRSVASFLAQDYVAYLLNVAAMNVLPIMVVGLLGARANAYFYVPFMIAAALDLLFINISASLTVEGAFSEGRLAEMVRAIIRRFGSLLAIAVPCVLLAAPVLLLPFGEGYAEHGTGVLRILILASLFRAVLSLFTSVSRVQRRATPLVVMHAVLITTLLGLTIVLHGPLGAEGVALAWLSANALVATAVLPVLVRAVRRAAQGAAT